MAIKDILKIFKKDSGWRRCKFHEECKETCGHKIHHEKNTGCLNACVCAPDELSCEQVPNPLGEEIL